MDLSRKILDCSPFPVLLLDAQGATRFANTSAKALDSRQLALIWEKVSTEGKDSSLCLDLDIRDGDEQGRWVEVSAESMTTDSERLWLICLHDITRRIDESRRLKKLLFVDELTGLYNRRGFLQVAHQHLKAAERAKRGMLLVFADLDGLKNINDTWGHREGDRALRNSAKVLRTALRESDIIGRMGGDEFAALLVDFVGDGETDIPVRRLNQTLDSYNARKDLAYPLAFSVGVARFDPADPAPVDDLLKAADRQMYTDKKSKWVARVNTPSNGVVAVAGK